MKRWLPYAVMLAGSVTSAAEVPHPDLAFDTLVVTASSVEGTVVNRGTAPSSGCNVDLQLFDARTHRITGSRRQTLRPLAPGARQKVAFEMEPAFLGQVVRLLADSQGRVGESDERNNVSESVDVPGARPDPIRVPDTTLPRRPPARTADPAQPEVDLAAEAVTTDGVSLKGTVRNVSAREFTGHRKALLSRETWGSAHVIERLDVAARAVPQLVPGEAWSFEVPSPHPLKDARKYIYRLSLDPSDEHSDNDVAQQVREQVRID
jgi:hypothetical protein